MLDLRRRLAQRLDVSASELSTLVRGVGLHAVILASLYVVRPLRDELGIQSGVQNMQWLFSGTFIGLLLVVPVYGWAASRLSAARLVPATLSALAVALVLGFVAWTTVGGPGIAAAGFIGLSVFNMLVVSVFWSRMADVFDRRRGGRWYGVVAAGGSVGALAGPAIATSTLSVTGPSILLLLAAGLLLAATAVAWSLPSGSGAGAEPLGGTVLDGVRSLVRTPILRGITVYLLMMTWVSTTLYFEQAQIVSATLDDSTQRASLFAQMDLAINAIAITAQLLLTGRLIRRVGLGAVLVALPVVAGGSLLAMALWPTLLTLVVVQVARRSVNFALAKPARELLYTAVDGIARYKGKNVVDTVVYRGGDAVAGWAFAGLQGLGLSLPAIAVVGLPVVAVWAHSALRLARLSANASSQGQG